MDMKGHVSLSFENRMSELIITTKKQILPLPHYLAINDEVLGIIKDKPVDIRLPEGEWKVTIRSMYRFIEGSTVVDVHDGAVTHISFSDRERWWNWLFNIDLILWVLKFFFTIPEPWDTIYEIVSNGFFAIWLLRLWIIRKRYFKFKIK